ncbi:hypothetical protein C8J57DRAFT_1046809 [Mycena rebaudengoi]|nr:hypothetical protein C8J57DRAFT_1046809 [Mycena rebaudengoi]
MQNLRAVRSRCKAVEKARSAVQTARAKKSRRLVASGVYTADARAMARMLVKAGCSQGKVGEVVRYVAKKAGLDVKGNMSRWTVQRALMEGGVAARIQLGFEMSQADDSGDATSLHGDNYEACHVMINKAGTHTMQVLGISSTIDHMSETQLANWKRLLSNICEIFKRSPLGRRSALNFELSDFLRLLKGMNGDQASDQKKTVRLMREWKKEVTRILLGYDEIQSLESSELVELIFEIRRSNLKEVGGEEAWNKLSNGQKDVLAKSFTDALALQIGKQAFEKLSAELKREIDLFFWVGCSMHKELNICSAFTDGLAMYYEENGLEGPVLLANKDNDATIRLAEETGDSTAAVQRALKVSERGAVKLVALLGAFVNHKDDKKGCHAIYENYFRPLIGAGVRYPDVSNTRYQEYGRGAARIVTYLQEHKDFMMFIKDKKTKRTLNHLEANIVKGLNCMKTVAELVALVLFCMALGHPYSRMVRGKGTENLNILDLGPLHARFTTHLLKLIDAPELLLSNADDSYRLAMLDGEQWSDPKAFQACLKLAPTLPHLKGLLVSGMRNGAVAWDCFTEEFKVGGAIDISTAEERDNACMPSTNDANEGLLGMWRHFSRESSSSTVGHFEDQAMFNKNDTQTFIETHLNTIDDQQFLRQEARAADASGVEQRRREELAAHAQQQVDLKQENDAKKAAKAAAETARLDAIPLELNFSKLGKMVNAALLDQLEKHRRGGDKNIPKKSEMSKKAQYLEALRKALELRSAGAPASVIAPIPS